MEVLIAVAGESAVQRGWRGRRVDALPPIRARRYLTFALLPTLRPPVLVRTPSAFLFLSTFSAHRYGWSFPASFKGRSLPRCGANAF